jgi:hypothetical protein
MFAIRNPATGLFFKSGEFKSNIMDCAKYKTRKSAETTLKFYKTAADQDIEFWTTRPGNETYDEYMEFYRKLAADNPKKDEEYFIQIGNETWNYWISRPAVLAERNAAEIVELTIMVKE